MQTPNSLRAAARAAASLALALSIFAAGSRSVSAAGNHLDYGFSADGRVLTAFGGAGVEAAAKGVVIQPDGKIVAVGGITSPGETRDFALARYNADGTLDFTFGGRGKVMTDILGRQNQAEAVALQPDGKIVAAGWGHSAYSGRDFAVVRYNANGTLDTTFGNGGMVLVDFGQTEDEARAVALQSNGKIVLAGKAGVSFGLARLNADGSLDLNFNRGGRVETLFGYEDGHNHSAAADVIVQPDGKIVAAGAYVYNTQNPGGSYTVSTVALARYTSGGMLDVTFGGDGRVTAVAAGRAGAVKRTGSGQYVVAGTAVDPYDSQAKFLLGRLNADGSPDTAFGDGGWVVTRYDSFSRANDLVLHPDGDITTAGVVVTYGNGSFIGRSTFTLMRYRSDGSPDDRWGAGGRVTTVFPAGSLHEGDTGAYAVALQTDGRVVAVGRSRNSFALARYEQQGIAARSDFNGDGRPDMAVFRPSQDTWQFRDAVTGAVTSVAWGTAGDVPVPGDYDGDGRTDPAVFRPSDGTWYVLHSSDQSAVSTTFGEAGDTPVQGDYDGDDRTDVAVFRPSTGRWYIQRTTLGYKEVSLGLSTDQPAQGDYDGDGLTDVAVFRPSDGKWYIERSLLGSHVVSFSASLGSRAAPADYDGDGADDLAFYDPGELTWHFAYGAAFWEFDGAGAMEVQFGAPADVRAPADYNGDGRADFTAFRPSNGTWYFKPASYSPTSEVSFGASGDVPVASAYTPQ